MNNAKSQLNLKYCRRCCMPETQEGIGFDDFGVCKACQSAEQKIHIDWDQRERQLTALLDDAKQKAGNNYDCIVPISGGKDSVYQLHVLTKIYDMKPLAVTFSHNWYSEVGWYNLMNCLEKFNVDHIMFTPNRELVGRLARQSLTAIGDACWHCHSGIGAFPMQVATKFGIRLLVWGESIAEASGRATYYEPVHKFDAEYFTKVSAKRRPDEMVCSSISNKDLYPFQNPTNEEIEQLDVYGIHLGDYLFWDEERQTEFLKTEYDWLEDDVEGAYKKFKSVECVMPGVHDFANYLKRGYGRATYQACIDVRAGLMTREEGFEIARAIDTVRPGALDYYLEITNLSEDEFFETLEGQRHPSLSDQHLEVLDTPADLVRKRPFVEEFLQSIRKKYKGK